MAKYKVTNNFRDIHTNDLYKENDEIELTEERAAEVNENLKDKGNFIELIETPQDPDGEQFDREAAKERLKELNVDFKGNASNDTLKQLLEENDNQEDAGQEDNEQVEDGK